MEQSLISKPITVIQTISDYRTYDFYYGAECRLKLPLNLNLYTVVRSMNRRGYKDEASNTTQWLWNSELTYSF